MTAGDALATGILDDAPAKFAQLLQAMLLANPTNLWGVLLLSNIATVLAVVQWLLMELRQAGLLVLAAMLTLAASGSLNRATRAWLDRLIGWLLAIVAYKPAAAFIYYLGFSYLSPRAGAPGDLGTILTGVLILGLAVVAMPVLLKFFSWSGTQIGGSGGSGSGTLAAAGAVALARAGRGPAHRPRRRPRSHGRGRPGGCHGRGGGCSSGRRARRGRTSSPAHHAQGGGQAVTTSAPVTCPPTCGSRGCTGTGERNAAGASVACRPPPPSSCSWPCWLPCWRRRSHPSTVLPLTGVGRRAWWPRS